MPFALPSRPSWIGLRLRKFALKTHHPTSTTNIPLLFDRDKMKEKSVMNNYFGIGIDAKISLDFHNKREEKPEKSRSRAKNYFTYGVLGSRELVQR